MNIKTLGSRVGGYFAISALALAISACGDSTIETVSGSALPGSYAVVSAPVGDISGLVTDTNGNGIEGATVYVGNQSTKTNSAGRYYFENVKVTQTKSQSDAESGAVYQQALTVSIVPAEGYISGTVTVWPQAQIFTSSENEDASPATVFISGFVAEAGAAVLPKLGAELAGVARNADTGAALANTTIHLDMLGTVGSEGELAVQQQAANGVTYSFATGDYTAITDENGQFTFTGLPEDSAFTAAISGFSVEAADGFGGALSYLDTTPESASSGVELSVAPFVSVDNVSPYVVKVAEVVNQASATGRLNDDFSKTLTIEFSEPLDMAKLDNSNSIVIRDVEGDGYLKDSEGVNRFSYTLTDKTLTVFLNEDVNITAGGEFEVFMLVDDFADKAGNILTTGDGVAYDSDVISATNADYIKLALVTFKETNLSASAVTNQAQLLVDTNGVDDSVLESEGYASFNDAFDGDWGVEIQGLNSVDSTNGIIDTEVRLTALGGALLKAADYLSENDESFSVISTAARVSFKASNASNYKIEVTRNSDPVNGFAISGFVGASFEGDAVVDVDGNIVTDGYNDTVYAGGRLKADANGSKVEFVLTGVEPGDVVEITPYDDLNNPGTAVSLTLKDTVSPTPVLQSSYGSSSADSLDDATGNFKRTYGDGGEVVIDGSGNELGYPVLNISPNLLALRNGTEEGVDADGIKKFVDLLKYNTSNGLNSANLEVRTYTDGTAEVPVTAEPDEGLIQAVLKEAGLESDLQVYDIHAYNRYTATDGADLSRKVGVAMSENVRLVEATEPAYAPDGVVISNWSVQNDVQLDDDNGSVNVDLMSFDVSDVLAWSLTGNGSVIDFSGAVQDEADNKASSQAKVSVKDAIPPFIAEASYSGSKITITFNEPVDLVKTGQYIPTIKLKSVEAIKADKALNADADPSNDVDSGNIGVQKTIELVLEEGVVEQSATGEVVTVFEKAWADGNNTNMPVKTIFDLAQYIEGVDVPSANTQPVRNTGRHTILAFDNIKDINGNSWSDYKKVTAESGFESVPSYALVNDSPTFSVQPSITKSLDEVNKTFTVTWRFTHPIDLAVLKGNAEEDGTLKALAASDVVNIFNVADKDGNVAGWEIDNNSNSKTRATLENDGKDLKVVIQYTGDISTDDTISFNSGVKSAWDYSETVNSESKIIVK